MDKTQKNADFIDKNRHRNVKELALELSKRHDLDAAFALRQIEGWQKLHDKVPSWAQCDQLIYPPRLALEQCSGEAAARYKAEVVRRLQAAGRLGINSMTDLTGGMGVDFSFLSPLFQRAAYVEQRPELVTAARHNFPLLHLSNATVTQADGIALLHTLDPADLLFIDPARRDEFGRKTVRLEDCEPHVTPLLPLLFEKCRVLMLKLSTMLDLHHTVDTLGCVAEAHVFASGGECKDLLLVCTAEPVSETKYFCANDTQSFAFTRREEAEALSPMADTIAGYLYEPNPAVMKAGAYKTVAQRHALQKLHPNTHLYCSSERHADFPGRVFRIDRVMGFSKKDLREITALGKANLTVRNFPATVAELRKKLKLGEGGDTFLFAATQADGRKILIVCRRP